MAAVGTYERKKRDFTRRFLEASRRGDIRAVRRLLGCARYNFACDSAVQVAIVQVVEREPSAFIEAMLDSSMLFKVLGDSRKFKVLEVAFARKLPRVVRVVLAHSTSGFFRYELDAYLYYAIKAGLPDLVSEILLAERHLPPFVDVNRTFHFACIHGPPEVIRRMLEYGGLDPTDDVVKTCDIVKTYDVVVGYAGRNIKGYGRIADIMRADPRIQQTLRAAQGRDAHPRRRVTLLLALRLRRRLSTRYTGR